MAVEQSSYAIRTIADKQEFTVSQANSLVSELKGLFESVRGQHEEIKEQSARNAAEMQQAHGKVLSELVQTKEQLHVETSQLHEAHQNVMDELHQTQSQMIGGWENEQLRSNALAQAVVETHAKVCEDSERSRTQEEKNKRTNERSQSSVDIPWGSDSTRADAKKSPPNLFMESTDGRPLHPTELLSTSVQQNSSLTPFIQVCISDPPVFMVTKYEMYRKELLWWRDLNNSVPDAQLVIHLTIKATDTVLKGLLTQYLERTRDSPGSRTMSDLLSTLDKELLRSSHEIALSKITLWTHFSRRPSESIRAYWLRFTKLESSLLKSGISFPPEVVFYKALGGLNLVQPQLGLILSTIEAKGESVSVTELRRLTQKILESHFLEPSEGILKIQDEEGEEDQLPEEPRLNCENEYESEVVDCFLGESDEVFELRKIRKATGRNRPGMKDNAIRNARVSYNVPNRVLPVSKATSVPSTMSKGTPSTGANSNVCWRCGKEGHMWRTCHLPFQRSLAFGNRPQSSASSQPLITREVLECSECYQPEDLPAQISSDVEKPSSLTNAKPVHTPTIVDDGEKLTETEWISRYRQSLDEAVLMVSQIDSCFDHILHAPSQESRRPLSPVIDCGATSSVVGSQWLAEFQKHATTRHYQSEHKRFKFGDNKEYISECSVEIEMLTEIYIHKVKETIAFWIRASVLKGLTVPLLISRQSLSKIQGRIDFSSNTLSIPIGIIRLHSTGNGHLLWPVVFKTTELLNEKMDSKRKERIQ